MSTSLQAACEETRTDIGSLEVQTRVCLDDATMLCGALTDLTDNGARVHGDTKGLEVGDEIFLEILFSLQYSVKHRCEIRHIQPGEYFGVQFTGQFERCLMWPPSSMVA